MSRRFFNDVNERILLIKYPSSAGKSNTFFVIASRTKNGDYVIVDGTDVEDGIYKLIYANQSNQDTDDVYILKNDLLTYVDKQDIDNFLDL